MGEDPLCGEGGTEEDSYWGRGDGREVRGEEDEVGCSLSWTANIGRAMCAEKGTG